MLENHLDEAKARYQGGAKDKTGCVSVCSDLAEEREGAKRGASNLRVRVTELESEVTALSVPAAELAETVRKRDRYQVLLQSVAAQAQSLQDGHADIVSCAKCRHTSRQDGLGPFQSESKPSFFSKLVLIPV